MVPLVSLAADKTNEVRWEERGSLTSLLATLLRNCGACPRSPNTHTQAHTHAHADSIDDIRLTDLFHVTHFDRGPQIKRNYAFVQKKSGGQSCKHFQQCSLFLQVLFESAVWDDKRSREYLLLCKPQLFEGSASTLFLALLCGNAQICAKPPGAVSDDVGMSLRQPFHAQIRPRPTACALRAVPDCCLCLYDTIDDAEYALKKTNATVLLGRTITVEFCQNEVGWCLGSRVNATLETSGDDPPGLKR
eukprot:scaffold130456_cov21-Tisochrysis_lutea.AAC.1